jgi:small subunit ribosomal protein S8
MTSDPIADMLTCIRNAASVRKAKVVVPSSNIKRKVAELLQSEGYLASVKETGEGVKKTLEIEVKFLPNGTTPVLKGLQRISKPGQRTYVGFDSIPRVRSGFGTAILSTSRGILVDRDAKKQKVGGELVCYVW